MTFPHSVKPITTANMLVDNWKQSPFSTLFQILHWTYPFPFYPQILLVANQIQFHPYLHCSSKIASRSPVIRVCLPQKRAFPRRIFSRELRHRRQSLPKVRRHLRQLPPRRHHHWRAQMQMPEKRLGRHTRKCCHAAFAGNVLIDLLCSIGIWGRIRAKGLMCVTFVKKASLPPLVWTHIEESTVGKNLMNVPFAEKDLRLQVIFIITEWHMLR